VLFCCYDLLLLRALLLLLAALRQRRHCQGGPLGPTPGPKIAFADRAITPAQTVWNFDRTIPIISKRVVVAMRGRSV
jgi:hypothetical protein